MASIVTAGATLIECSTVVKDYFSGEETIRAVAGVDLALRAGEFVALMGPSGSGKSTLLQLLGGLERPTVGGVFYEGVDISAATDRELAAARREHVGFIFQSFNLIPRLSALENVILPAAFSPAHDRRAAIHRGLDLLDRFGLADRAQHSPAQLSGGQRQRVAIARALINDPKVILADEPTGNVDSTTGATILRELDALRREGRAILVVTHDPNVAARADRTLHMMDGRVLAAETRRDQGAVA